MNISVVIPCYDADRFIGQAIRSVLQQSHRPAEVIVVDDGSTDDSRAVVRQFGEPVRLIEGEHAGAARARNRGAAAAECEAIMFMDADDVLGSGALAALVMGLWAEPVGGLALVPWRRLEWIDGRWVEGPPSSRLLQPGQDYLDAWLMGWYHPPCAVLWAREDYDRVGGWDAGIAHNPNDDGELMMRALALGVPLKLMGQGMAYYRRPQQGVDTLSGTRLREEGLQARLAVFEKLTDVLRRVERLDPHREAIGYALDRLAADCGTHFPEVAARARARAREVAGPAERRALFRRRNDRWVRFTRLLARLRHPRLWLRQRLGRRIEVEHGLEEIAPTGRGA